jgi:ribosomal protein L11 methylase PrmA
VSDQDRANPPRHASSTGQALTNTGWLDAHVEANRPEYEAMLRSVAFAPGWHVLDAGCGSGILAQIGQLVRYAPGARSSACECSR